MAKRRRSELDDDLPTLDNTRQSAVGQKDAPESEPPELDGKQPEQTTGPGQLVSEVTIRVPVMLNIPTEGRVYAERLDCRLTGQNSARAMESLVRGLTDSGVLSSDFHQVNRAAALRWIVDQVTVQLASLEQNQKQ